MWYRVFLLEMRAQLLDDVHVGDEVVVIRVLLNQTILQFEQQFFATHEPGA